MTSLLPTPPKNGNVRKMSRREIAASLDEWFNYGVRVHAWALSQVEQTETQGLGVYVKYDHPGGSSEHSAFFCVNCSRLHATTVQFDKGGDPVIEVSLDPHEIRKLAKRLEKRHADH